MYNNMYEAFDPFLASKTWHRDETADRERRSRPDVRDRLLS